jgi:hypothetical protein
MYIVHDKFFNKLEFVKNIKDNKNNMKIDIMMDVKIRQQYCLFEIKT